MRVFVTGTGGFIGSSVARQLLVRGHEVHGLMAPGESRRRLNDVADRCAFYEADLADEKAIGDIVLEVRPEAALHLAWYAVPGAYWRSPENLACVAHGMALARILAEHGCRRLVGAGTCAEYDWAHADLVEDATPCRPRTLYGAAKLALYLVLSRYSAEAEVGFAWARFAFLYGPGENAGRLVPSVIEGLAAGEDVACTTGAQERDFLHVGDAADAMVAMLESPVQGAVNVGAGEVVQVRTVVEALARIIGGKGRPCFGALPTPDGEPARLRPDVTRLRDEVGWRPSRTLEAGLRETVEAARARRAGVA